MRRRIFLASAMLIPLALSLSGCIKRKTLRFRLTVEVNTPQGVKSGSSVLEGVSQTTNMILKEYPAQTVLGEAPVIDLGNRKYLFALLENPLSNKNRTMWTIFLDVLRYPELHPRLDKDVSLFPQAERHKPFGIVRPENYPLLVAFTDLNDPKTVLEVKPDGMTGTFGTGYSIRQITIQVVDNGEPLTTGIEEKLAWLRDKADSPLEPMPLGGPRQTVDQISLARRLSRISFVSGRR